jgi:hypothetical protein
MNFKEKLQILIDSIENWLSDPEDNVQLIQWHDEVNTIIHYLECSELEESYLERIVEMYDTLITARIKRKYNEITIPTNDKLDELLGRKQTEQRTAAWYEQMATILSASELGHLFGSLRERAQLVMSKTVPYTPRYQPLAIPSDTMSPFDWGIRFEPVVKQIYEDKYGVTLKELGRLQHLSEPRCSASPDGLVYHCPNNIRTGRLIEIKCPVTREIDGTIPKDYYSQMQMQLQVTGLMHCDYIEAVFASKYNNNILKEGPSYYNGYIAVIRYAEIKGGQEFYYIYSPINVVDWNPDIQEGEEIVEITPWKLMQWSEQLVTRNEGWWQALRPIMDSFWEDVEKAKRGEFTIPESKRAPKKQKIEKCLIQFHKLDEDGNNMQE